MLAGADDIVAKKSVTVFSLINPETSNSPSYRSSKTSSSRNVSDVLHSVTESYLSGLIIIMTTVRSQIYPASLFTCPQWWWIGHLCKMSLSLCNLCPKASTLEFIQILCSELKSPETPKSSPPPSSDMWKKMKKTVVRDSFADVVVEAGKLRRAKPAKEGDMKEDVSSKVKEIYKGEGVEEPNWKPEEDTDAYSDNEQIETEGYLKGSYRIRIYRKMSQTAGRTKEDWISCLVSRRDITALIANLIRLCDADTRKTLRVLLPKEVLQEVDKLLLAQ